MHQKITSQQEWLAAREEFLVKEKAFTKARDELSRQRRDLPCVRVEKDYVFEGADGSRSMADLFKGKDQLIVYHFMLGPDWEEGCTACSFWADNFEGIEVHLAHRDVSLVVVADAPQAKLAAYRKRMGWTTPWFSAHGNDFNKDFHVAFTPQQLEAKNVYYNYHNGPFPVNQASGISVFLKDDNGDIYHTYSCYSRGLDMLNGPYHYLDLTPKGRDEDDLSFSMAWLRRHDQYEA